MGYGSFVNRYSDNTIYVAGVFSLRQPLVGLGNRGAFLLMVCVFSRGARKNAHSKSASTGAITAGAFGQNRGRSRESRYDKDRS